MIDLIKDIKKVCSSNITNKDDILERLITDYVATIIVENKLKAEQQISELIEGMEPMQEQLISNSKTMARQSIKIKELKGIKNTALAQTKRADFLKLTCENFEKQIKELEYRIKSQNEWWDVAKKNGNETIAYLKKTVQELQKDDESKAEQINELEEGRLDYTKWLIEEFDNQMIDKVSDEDAQSYIDDYNELNKH